MSPQLWSLALAAALCTGCTALTSREPGLRVVTQQSHRGWHDAVIVGNGQVEAVIVPSVGRVMQFRFAGETDGPFWENDRLAGQPMPAKPWEAAHGSFGGDKTWPAPQSLWNWPPPDVFDTAPLAFRVTEDRAIVLTSPVSARFGIRTERRITLDRKEPVMRIETTYEKVSGDPVEVGVWVITQAKDPEAIFLPVPAGSKFPVGTTTLWGVPTNHLSRAEGMLRLTRDRKDSHKIGNDGTSIVWVGAKELLRVDLPRMPGATYPDDGCSAEIYTNPDPVPYVELETLGPVKTLRMGDRLSATNTYRLARRVNGNVSAEAKALLAQ
jgi:hypothetical protein